MSASEALKAVWRNAGSEPSVCQTSEHIIPEIERRYHVTLPDDFRDYLVQAAPNEGFMDRSGVTWWSPEQMKNIPEGYEHSINNPVIERESEGYIFFADYMIWCWAWAICCRKGENYGKVGLIGGLPDHWVADSFDEFVTDYLQNPDFVF